MTVTLSLVVGFDGSTSKGGSSRGISSPADTERFLERRRSADCIIIGGNTARNEPYQRTPAPLVVLSRSLVNPIPGNHLAHVWNLSAREAIERATRIFGPEIHVEAGLSIIQELLTANLIDRLELSQTNISGGENVIDLQSLLAQFEVVEVSEVDGTTFTSARRKI